MSKEEFGKLFREQRKRLVRLVYRWGATLDEAEEIVQESFEVLWKKILDGERLESQIAFLLTVCRNKTLNVLTNSYRKNRLLGEDPSDEEAGEEEGGGDEFSDSRLRQDCIKQKLDQFESDYPEAAYAVRMQFEGSSILKIAEAISRTVEATRQYLYQVKKKIKPYLEECRE